MSSSNYYEYELITHIELSKRLVNNSTDPESVLPDQLVSTYIEITATDANGDPADIFVYQVEPINYDSLDTRAALFSNVCSPNDWQELPIGVPTDEETLYFRLNTLKAICRSAAESDLIWTSVIEDVEALIAVHKSLLDPPSDDNIQSDTYTAS